MKKLILSIALVLTFAIFSLAEETTVKAMISYLKGGVKITKSGQKESVPAKLGMPLGEGDKIETGEGVKLEIKLEDGTNIRIGENTSLVLDILKQDKDKNSENSSIKVFFGKIWMNVKKNVGQESKVITPKAVAAVKGTTYRVDVAKDGESNINVYDGTVAVSEEGKEVLVKKLEKINSKDLTKSSFDEQDDAKDDWVKWNKSRDKLRVMIVANETVNKEKSMMPTSEAVMIREFLNNYLFSVVDQAQISNIRDSEKLKAALKGDAAAAAAAGLEFGADISIVIETKVGIIADKELMGSLVSAKVQMAGKAFKNDDAMMLSANTQSDTGVDISEESSAAKGIESGSKKLATKFIDDIVKSWKETARKGDKVTVNITNVSFAKLDAIKQILAKIDGVKNLEQVSFQANRALLDVTFAGDPSALADKIVSTDFKDTKIEVVGLTAFRVELEAK